MIDLDILGLNLLSIIDNSGYIIAIVGYTIVFIALFSLYLVFYYFPKWIKQFNAFLLIRKGQVEKGESMKSDVSAEENAAVAASIYIFFNDLHDDESNVITIKKVSKTYSPWSSKIYGLRTFDR